jgi:hypothetical protein
MFKIKYNTIYFYLISTQNKSLKNKFINYKMCAQTNTVETRGMRWDQTLISKAEELHYYIKVSEDKGGQLVLSGAGNRWKKNGTKEDIYINEIRLAGSKENIQKVLERQSYAQKDIDRLISGSYTCNNYDLPEAQGGRKEQFQDEINKYKEFKKKNNTKQKPSNDISLQKLDLIVKELNDTDSKKNMPAKNTRRYWILEKYSKLTEGKVLDVSLMKQDGSGIKIRSVPKPNSTKYGNFLNVPVVSSLYGTYEYTLKILQASLHLTQTQLNDCITEYKTRAGIISRPQTKRTRPEKSEKATVESEVKETVKAVVKESKKTPPRETLKTLEPTTKKPAQSRLRTNNFSSPSKSK